MAFCFDPCPWRTIATCKLAPEDVSGIKLVRDTHPELSGWDDQAIYEAVRDFWFQYHQVSRGEWSWASGNELLAYIYGRQTGAISFEECPDFARDTADEIGAQQPWTSRTASTGPC